MRTQSLCQARSSQGAAETGFEASSTVSRSCSRR